MRKYPASGPMPEYNFECPYCMAPYCYLSADAYHYNYFDDTMDCYECGMELTTVEHMRFCNRILTFPDAILEWKIAPVTKVTNDVIEYIKAMVETAKRHKCLGLSAPQVGWNARVILVDGLTMINPKIIDKTGKEAKMETCRSLPDYSMNIVRATEIVVEYRNIDENYETILAFDDHEIARVIQHQIDHLDGKLILV